MDNYEVSRDRARAYYLKTVGGSRTLTFLGQPYRIAGETGAVFRDDGIPAGFGESLAIYDLLCHESPQKTVTGRFAPVNSLKGLPPGAGVGTDFHSRTAARFDADPEAFCRACVALGGERIDMGDIGFRFPVFGPLCVLLKFYRADEDFPASLTLLWEENMLQYIYYETVYYIAGFLLGRIADEMGRQ